MMSINEARAWERLIALGAKKWDCMGQKALDLTTIRITSKHKMERLVPAILNVVSRGKNPGNSWHVNRMGRPVLVVERQS